MDHSNHNNSSHNHQEHHRMMIRDFRKRFWIATGLSIPVLLLSPMIQSFLGLDWSFSAQPYFLFVFASFIFGYGGYPFLMGLVKEIRDKALGMMTLISIAITVAYTYSSAVVFGLPGKMFFWELATLIDLMLVGHWIEMRSVVGASKALEKLARLMPSEAHLIENGQIKDVSIDQLKKGDVILVKSFDKVPADGEIVEGESYINESMLTGESKPIKKNVGDQVIGGSVNGNSSLKIIIEKTGKEGYLQQVIGLVEEAQNKQSKTQHLADKAAKWLAYIALTSGVITLTVWWALGYDFVYALERMVTVMVISCPHALGLAIPLVVAISTALSAQNGILIRNRTAFENARNISAVVFDKTGTLTLGDFSVTRIVNIDQKYSEKEIILLAGALEQNSEHPIAQGILKKAEEWKLSLPTTSNFGAITGKGVTATVDGKNIKVVSPGYLKEQNISIPNNAYQNEVETVVFILLENALIGSIALADKIRPESKQAIDTLKKNGIKVMMATGDNERTAKAVSEELGLDKYFAQVLPHEKVEVVKQLQKQGEFVAMTGDGVNDAPALAEAGVGIAIGSGTDVAVETADIILVNSNPQDIAQLILFGKATYRKMTQNLIWATAYNALALPLAAGVLYPIGFTLSPALGAVLMSLSTIVVAINAQLLKKQVKAKL
ncbi:copper-translocating P-type ATPase [Microscilla marina]|uniref:Copper-translocating P-type ATPase n=1 Tax=Microscilla marina ATCC 23134 TaxID=313606 RepID=A1ZIH4_MICM2|nr:copper-translocating P-type ATPase [Microscilla marina]EAY29842.1 copper-translocating P-type ATPase [Microscilla marina ATCC 23134]